MRMENCSTWTPVSGYGSLNLFLIFSGKSRQIFISLLKNVALIKCISGRFLSLSSRTVFRCFMGKSRGNELWYSNFLGISFVNMRKTWKRVLSKEFFSREEVLKCVAFDYFPRIYKLTLSYRSYGIINHILNKRSFTFDYVSNEFLRL